MEPETSLQKIGPERAPVERAPNKERNQETKSLESAAESGLEHREQASEPSGDTFDNNGISGVFPVTTPQDDTTLDDSSSDSSTPILANDDDLIEKEWVDRAKKIVADTRDNPYKQEKAVNELQKDYQKKRYGRERKAA